MTIFNSLLLPFVGTVLGAASVFFIKNGLNPKFQSRVLGFAAGVMLCASFYSLIIPAVEASLHLGKMSFFPAVFGILSGIAVLSVWDRISPETASCPNKRIMTAVCLHNIPEGMAVGVALAGATGDDAPLTMGVAFTLALGIAMQNLPEGAIISLPMAANGEKKLKSFIYGALSGISEPMSALIVLFLAQGVTPFIPFFLSFAAGNMLYVTLKELVSDKTNMLWFSMGVCLLIVSDCIFG